MNKAIDEMNQYRIADDAYIAVDALESIITVAREGALHPKYLQEKLDVAQRYLCFMKEFTK